MSNDISGELHKHIVARHGHAKTTKPADSMKVCAEEVHAQSDYSNEQNYLDMLGRTKVNMDKTGMDKRVALSLEKFKQDSEYAQDYIDFCDTLQERGYSLEDAVIGTDIIFNELRQKSTYQS